MTEERRGPGIGGYDFDQSIEAVSVPDYDLFGTDEPATVDMLGADRAAEERAERMVRSLGRRTGIYTTYRPVPAAEFVRERKQRFEAAMGAAAKEIRHA